MKEKSLAWNTSLNFLGQAVPTVWGIICIPFIIKGLGPERFGILALAWSIIVYFSLFDLGLGQATTKFVSEYLGKKEKEKLPSIIWTALFFNVLLGLTGGIIFALTTPFLVTKVLNIPAHLLEESYKTFLILAASVPVLTSSLALRGVLEGYQRFDLVNAVKAPASSMNFLIPAFAIPLGFNLPEIVLFLLIARLCAMFIYLILCFKISPNLKKKFSFDKKLIRTIFTFGLWITVSNIVGPITVYLDRFLIGSLLTIEAVTFYTAPHEIVTKLWILPKSLVLTVFPVFSSLGIKLTKELGDIYAKALKYLLLIMGAMILVLVLFAEEILQIWVGFEFVQRSTLVFQILALGILLNSLARVPFTLYQGIGRPDIPAKFHLLELPIYIILAWFLIRKFGITGAALAWTIRVGLDTILLFVASWRRIPFTRPALTQKGMIGTIISYCCLSALSIPTLVFHPPLLIKIFIVIILLSVFYAVVWKYLLDSTEKTFISSTINSLKRGFK